MPTPSAATPNRQILCAAELVRAQPDDAYLAEIVEVLKYPTAAGKPTDLLLKRLKERFPDAPGAEAGLDANLAWIAQRFPQIDVKSPPKRPLPLPSEADDQHQAAGVQLSPSTRPSDPVPRHPPSR